MTGSPVRFATGGPGLARLLLAAALFAGTATRLQAICHGDEPADGSADFVVELLDSTLHCTGILIGDGWILTAAHCGNVQQVRTRTSLASFTVKPESCFHHPDFNEVTKENDVELFRLETSPSVPSLALVEPGWKEGPKTTLTINGWAPCLEIAPPTLKHAFVQLVSTAGCATQYRQRTSIKVSDQQNFCTASDVSRVSPADSGGAVIVFEPGKPQRLGGVISSGYGPFNLPDRHMRLTAFLTWIHGVEGGNTAFTTKKNRCSS